MDFHLFEARLHTFGDLPSDVFFVGRSHSKLEQHGVGPPSSNVVFSGSSIGRANRRWIFIFPKLDVMSSDICHLVTFCWKVAFEPGTCVGSPSPNVVCHHKIESPSHGRPHSKMETQHIPPGVNAVFQQRKTSIGKSSKT